MRRRTPYAYTWADIGLALLGLAFVLWWWR